MERLTLESVERYIELNNELAFEDPYVLKITKNEFIRKQIENLKSGCLDIFILSNDKEDVGFIECSMEDDTAIIEKIFVRRQYNNTYKNMLEFIHKYYCNTNIRKIKFIGVNDKVELIEVLKGLGYVMEKEHIQMEKTITELSERNFTINNKTFYEIGNEKWVYNFIKKCMVGSSVSYTEEEINELININSDLVFVLYEDNQPIGFMISFINEKRNKQENKNVIYIEEIAILKEFRNRGYGCKVLEYILDKGRKSGMDIARLHVYRHNEAAYRLYKKLGFNEIKNIGHWVKSYYVEEIFNSESGTRYELD